MMTMDEIHDRFSGENVYSDIISEYKDIEQMSLEELKAETQQWRLVMQKVPPIVQGWLLRYGKDLLLKRRDYEAVQGRLIGFNCSVTDVTVEAFTSHYDRAVGQHIVDRGLMTMKLDGSLFVMEVDSSMDKQDFDEAIKKADQ